jgi:glutaconate CoA-transferase subunit B
MFGLATPIAVFEKRHDRLALKHWHPESSLDEVTARTGFTFDAEGATPTALPTARERDALAALDKDGAFERDAGVRLR